MPTISSSDMRDALALMWYGSVCDSPLRHHLDRLVYKYGFRKTLHESAWGSVGRARNRAMYARLKAAKRAVDSIRYPLPN